jgi:hypothetical protein
MTKPTPRRGAAARVAQPARLEWMDTFLAALAETGLVKHAAKVAQVATTTVYGARRRDPQFAREFRRAQPSRAERRKAIAATRKPGAGHSNSAWRKHFLEALAETSNVSAAAERVKKTTQAVYKARREEPEFAAGWRTALVEGYDNLEMELLGYFRSPTPDRKLDVASALRLLTAHRETVARERALREDDDEQAVLDSIDKFIDEMRDRRAANAAILIEAGPDDGED